ncbi:hypothetical protein, partial [Chryseobacterium artocarpi]|uniref:glycoside hydrolase family 19 protein n=1 Tax=Chryseobacterium artocarpi TaxID=1414727 RepID=UPI003F31E278
IVGNTEAYSLSVFENVMTSNPFSFPPPKVKWDLYVQDRNGWRIAKGNIKEGENITYKFTAKSLKYKALKIEVVRGKDKGELYIKPQEAEDPKIISVELQDINSERLPKGKLLHYTDTIIAKAHCVGMFGYKVAFTLWEDDAIGKGHDPIVNMMNKINQIPLIGEVNHEGVAKVYFRLPAYTMAVQIANAGVAKGDKSEGKTHEYYVTAEVVSKHIAKASPNVNVANPSHIPAPPKKTKPVDNTLPHRKPPVAPEPHKTKPNKPKPKEETAKYPQTPAAKKQTDPEGKIVNAEFTDGRGKTLKNAKTGDTVSIKITSQGMRGKNIIVRIWEEDLSRYSNDLIYEVSATLAHDTSNFINYVTLTKGMYNKSNDFGEGNEREYFIEVEHLNTSVTSQVIPISSDAEPVKVDPNDSPAIIKETKQEKPEDGKCPNCEKNITLEQIKAICVSKKDNKGKEKCLVEDDTMIKKALPFLNQFRKKVGINTCITKAHFLAQISHESKFYELQERFKYSSASRMNGIFDSYFKQFGKNRMHEAERLSELSLKKENWSEVANAIYGKTHPLGKKHTNPDDGWRYSGKGFKQITWKDNYVNLQSYTNTLFGKNYKWADGDNPYKLKNNPEDAITSALGFWGKSNINSVATEISNTAVKNVTILINPALDGLSERERFFKKAVDILKVKECKPKGKVRVSNEKGTVVLVSGTDKILKNDPAKVGLQWMMYKTFVYKDISLDTFKKLKRSNNLPEADYVTYLSRDTHQVKSSNGKETFKHSAKRFGKYNEIPPGEYFLVPGLAGQKYMVYVIDSESKSASDENGIDGPDGSRGGVALHHYCPRFSVGCFTFNSGKNTQPVKDFVNEIPDLKLRDNRPVHFILEPREVVEITWENSAYGTK